MKSRIKAIHAPELLKADINISKMEGAPAFKRPTFYRDVTTGKEYAHIAGAIGWPHGSEPGFVIFVGVDRATEKFHVIDEYENKSLFNILDRANKLRKKWGYGVDDEHLQYLVADTDRFYTLTSQLAIVTKLYLTDPVDFEDKHSFSGYIQAIISAAYGSDEEKTLFFDNHNLIVTRLTSMGIGAQKHGKHEDYPAAFALGGLVQTLTLSRPWEVPNPEHDTGLTIEEREYIETMEEMGVAPW